MQKQKKENYNKSSTALGICQEWLHENPVDQLDETFRDILTKLDGSGDSVFDILRPLLPVKLVNSDSETEVESLSHHNSDSAVFEDDSESYAEDKNSSSSQILSTTTSVTSVSNDITTRVGDTDKDSLPMDEPPESEVPPEGEDAPEGEVPPEGEDAPEDEAPTSESEPTQDAAPESEEPTEETPPPDATAESDQLGPDEETNAALPVTETSEDEPTELPKIEGSHLSVDRISTISNIPVTDSAVLADLKEADEQAIRTAMLIQAMRQSIALYNEKEELTDEDAKKLEIKQKELMQKLAEFEEITKKVQRLVGLSDTSSLSLPTEEKASDVTPQALGVTTERKGTDVPGQELGEISEYLSPEDKLPKVVVCGIQDQVPRIIVCEGLKRKRPGSPGIPGHKMTQCKKDCPNLMLSLTGRLNESYHMQERLASENADLEGVRYSLQEELLCKDNAVDCLQRKVGSLQAEMRIIVKENSMLSEKVTELTSTVPYSSCPSSCGRQQNVQANYGYGPQGMPPGMGPGDMGCRIQQYSNNTCQMECQLNQIENEVKLMQNELGQVQRERQQLEQQRKMIKCTAALGPNAGVGMGTSREATCNPQLRELREQYNRLQDDFKSKVTEVAALRCDNEKLKQQGEFAREAQEAAEAKASSIEERIKQMESESKKFMGSKEQLIDQEQQLNVAKQRFREAQDELEEIRGLVQDQATQLEDYRNKYLQAQQQVEEQRRQIDLMEMDNSRISEQVNIEIQRVKNQFQEKLQELTPLPDLLKATQLKLQEAQQMRLLAERNLEEMGRELQEAKEQTLNLTKRMDDDRNSMQLGADERSSMMTRLEGWEKKSNELKDENAKLKASMARVEEVSAQNQKRLDEKLHEVTQLTAQLETVREESARQVARTKDRSETMRRSLQCQISDLERQLAQSRATARAAQKDRDEIRQRMQSQINNLNDNFDQAQMRIRSLQSHVNFLKTSYTNIFGGDNGNLMITDASPSTLGLDTCDCNF